MTSTKTIIVGAKGQLGIELLRSCPADSQTIAVDLPELDITDEPAVQDFIKRNAPTAIINCAAYTAVDKAEADASIAFRVNRDGARNLARAAKLYGAQMVHISTDFVFDGAKSQPYQPADTANPLNVYGLSKLAGEVEVAKALDGAALIVRTAWLYSPHGQNFVKTILRLMQEKKELRVVSDQVGTPTSACSLSRAIWTMLKCDAHGIHHYTDAGVASWFDFACAIRDLAEHRTPGDLAQVTAIRTIDYPTPAKRPPYSVLDKSSSYALVGPGPHWRHALMEVMNNLLPSQKN